MRTATNSLFVRRAPTAPSTINETARTVEVVFTTGADVRRRDWEGEYIERLSVEPGAVNLSELVGAPVLDNHDRTSVRSILGTIESARMTGSEGRAVIRLSDRADVEPIWRDVMAGIISRVSVGYSVEKWIEELNTETGERVRIAAAWTPREISFVSIPADSGAKVRNQGAEMSIENEVRTPEVGAPIGNTRARTDGQIRDIVELAGLERSIADDMIRRGLEVDEARREAIAGMVTRAGSPIRTEAPPRVVVGESYDDPEIRARHMGEALFARFNPAHAPTAPARQFYGRSMADLAAECLRVRNLSTVGMTPAAIVTRALHSTSDFPLLLGDAVGRTLRAAYEAAPSGIKQIARQSTARDFRAKSRVMLGEAPSLERVGESGEFKRGSMAEAGESYKLDTYGRIIALTRQAIVNDDLGAFADLSRRVGAAAAEFEARFLVNLLTSNPTMADDEALFSAAHGNAAGSGSKIDVASLGTGRKALRGMKGLDGETPINAAPRFLLVPAALETDAEKVLAALYAAKVADVNPFSGALVPVVDPRLDAISETAWYLAADPAHVETIEYSYLESEPGPQIETRAGFDVDGIEIKVRLDFGAGVVDWRGMYRNAGV